MSKKSHRKRFLRALKNKNQRKRKQSGQSAKPVETADATAWSGLEMLEPRVLLSGNAIPLEPLAIDPIAPVQAVTVAAEVVVDNQDATGFATTGNWLESSAVDEYLGSSLYSFNAGDTATWTPDLPEAGEYQVYIQWSRQQANGNFFDRDSQAQYAVTHNGTTDSYVIDQDIASGQWVAAGHAHLHRRWQ